jgi:hypothetical protein
MTTPLTTLTIEYTDAQGQVQRTEHLSGSHFSLRVQSDALSVISAEATHESTPEPLHTPMPASTQSAWQRVTPWAWALILFGIFAALSAAAIWIEYNPDDGGKNYVTVTLGLVGAIAAWASVWALLGKIFAKHADFWRHVCRVLIAGIALSLLTATMHFLSFSLSWHMLGRMDTLVSVTALALLVWAHLRLIVPAQRSKALRAGMLTFTVASVALLMWNNHRRSDTVLDTFHSPHLYRPWLQLSSPQSSQAFFEQAKSLETALKSKAGQTEPGEDMAGSQED